MEDQGLIPCSHIKPRRITELPQEVLLHIFGFIRDPLHFYDPSIIQGARSSWMRVLRTHKALALTCKAFVGPATTMLYGEVVLRRMGQIPALARTLDPDRTPSAQTLSQLVRSIHIDSCQVWAPFADVMKEDLRAILERCTALQSFSLVPHYNGLREISPHEDVSPLTDWLVGSSTHLSLLRPLLFRGLLDLAVHTWETSTSFVSLCSALECAQRLTKLSICTGGVDSEVIPGESLRRPLSLSRLKELHVSGVSSSTPNIAESIRDWWCMPQLEALIICAGKHGIFEFPPSFLRRHGAHLTYLDWGSGSRYVCNAETLLEVLDYCPRLEHLVTKLHRALLCPQIRCPHIRSPTLRFLDFQLPRGFDVLDEEEPVDISSLGSGCPRLERVRLLAYSCMYQPIFVRHCKTSHSANDDDGPIRWVAAYCNARMPSLMPLDLNNLEALQSPNSLYYGDDSDDSTYEYSSDSSDDDTESLSEGEDEDLTLSPQTQTHSFGAAHLHHLTLEPADREALLDMFHESQSRPNPIYETDS
ncbi:hypothetical protein FKP32DRAFT_1592009, partial [Trametes sanguinea]